MKEKPLLIIIAGPNGSGKTTVTSKILEHEWTETCLYVNPDTIAQNKYGDWNSPEGIRAGFFIRLFFVCTNSPKINASRITNRVLEGGHDVPITKIISRYGKSIANACVAVSLVDRAYFYDNSANHEDAKLLFRTKNGLVSRKYTEDLPIWANEIFEAIK